ncbi:uncharacterized protein LOC124929662 [Impatiens glandulifera]|uniref:uncharacterized protein LOC124929662 n=1 Tax=Impatiens glandulifera TaxID=253017 RepID=UPI001FB1627A|nr:uncharacterized protein LOC124929662 [Impatiens glandulifera]
MSSSSCSSFPDVYAWFLKLPPITQWQSDSSMSILLNQPYLNLKVTKNGSSSICFSIVVANFSIPISLWTSKPIKLPTDLIMSTRLVNDEIMFPLLTNIIQDELKYCPDSNENASRIDHDHDQLVIINNFKDMMAMIINISFLTLTFLICVYDAPKDIRSECLNILREQLACSYSRETMKIFVGLLGSNLEEKWIRTMNLAITNWLSENQTEIRTYPSSCLFSYALSTSALWKVQVYCPVIDMDIESSTYYPSTRPPSPPDERLWFSLNYHQLESVIQLNYKVIVRDTWIDVIVNIDNIRYI